MNMNTEKRNKPLRLAKIKYAKIMVSEEKS